jgi:uncharacterized protein YggE
MSRRVRWAHLLGAVVLVACAPAKSDIQIDLGDVDDYAAWLIASGQEVEPIPFEADPLIVSADGIVRAVPDIAVIVATLKADDANESRAVDTVSGTINAVQAALSDRIVETGFTALRSRPDYDERCLNTNVEARRRHGQISNDYWFNRRLDERGNTETRRRLDRPRLRQQVCQATTIEVSTQMVIRVQPASDAGAVLRALGDAGASEANLFGYDFSDYDSLYQAAAQQAVVNAKAKADAVSTGAHGPLGELVDMTVSPPKRIRRFGPQPIVIRPKRPSSGNGVSALQSHSDRQAEVQNVGGYAPPPAPNMVWARESGAYDEIIVTGSRMQRDTVSSPASLVERRSTDGFSDLASSQASVSGAARSSNALTMSLMSGPQTIRVSATLSYAYPTPLDGVLITERDDDR